MIAVDAVDQQTLAEDGGVRRSRLLRSSGGHHEIGHGILLKPEEIVAVVLDGVRVRREESG